MNTIVFSHLNENVNHILFMYLIIHTVSVTNIQENSKHVYLITLTLIRFILSMFYIVHNKPSYCFVNMINNECFIVNMVFHIETLLLDANKTNPIWFSYDSKKIMD